MEYKYYKTKDLTRWDTLAYEFYGDCFKTQPLIKANPHIPLSVFIKPDTVVYVPVLETSTQDNEGLPIWKTN